MNCVVCNEQTEIPQAAYCPSHERAFENLKHAFTMWTAAYGSLSAPDFLQRVQTVRGAGTKVKEIARFLLENPSRWE